MVYLLQIDYKITLHLFFLRLVLNKCNWEVGEAVLVGLCDLKLFSMIS